MVPQPDARPDPPVGAAKRTVSALTVIPTAATVTSRVRPSAADGSVSTSIIGQTVQFETEGALICAATVCVAKLPVA